MRAAARANDPPTQQVVTSSPPPSATQLARCESSLRGLKAAQREERESATRVAEQQRRARDADGRARRSVMAAAAEQLNRPP